MKMILSWLNDPYVHILIVIVVVIKMATNWSTGGDPAETAATRTTCMVCRITHSAYAPCETDRMYRPTPVELARIPR